MIMISKADLESLVLTMMRNHPACGDLRKIRIETDASGRWAVMPAHAAPDFPMEVRKAARKAEFNLRPVYGIAPDP